MITVPAPSKVGASTGNQQLPPVLLMHGVGSSFRHNWEVSGWLDLFADEGRPVLGFELPGHGEQADWSVERGEEISQRLLDDLDGVGPVDAVGFSAGAQMLAATASLDPSPFRRIALLGMGNNLLHPNPQGPIGLGERLAAEDESTVDADVRLFRRLARSAGNDPMTIARYLKIPRPPVTTAGLAAITAPTLVLIGERDFAMPADELAQALPNGQLKVLPRIDHFGLTSNVACMDAVLSFLGGPDA
jgi:pimeloyl-ACP methyl ester carboxylesterase